MLVRVVLFSCTFLSIKALTMSTNDRMSNVCNRLVDRLSDKVSEMHASSSYYWIGIGGGAGSGETTVATTIQQQLNRKYDREVCAVIGQDGFHYSKQKLSELFGADSLLRRGAPFTFDTPNLVDTLTRTKKLQAQGESVWLPTYNREISDPVPNGMQLHPRHCIVLVEGLYMLHFKDTEYASLKDLWDERWFVKGPSRETQRERLVQRSLRTWSDLKTQQWGPGREGATKRAEYNDFANNELIEYCEDHADEVIVTI